MTKTLIFSIATLAFLPTLCMGQNGSDINQAIPIYFGQTINDTVDKSTKPAMVYSIALAKGQQVNVTATTTIQNPGWSLCLEAPTVTTVALSSCLVGNSGDSNFPGSALSYSYQVATAGAYYIYVRGDSSGVAYQLQVTAQGTPIVTPNPTQAGCLTGQIDYITYSLQLIAAQLPDSASIGGTQMCASCTVKPPAYPALVGKMEKAMGLNIGVSACYDSAGNIFQLKLMHP